MLVNWWVCELTCLQVDELARWGEGELTSWEADKFGKLTNL